MWTKPSRFDFAAEPEVYRARKGALFPSTAESSGHRHFPWALPKVLHAVVPARARGQAANSKSDDEFPFRPVEGIGELTPH